MNLPVVMPQLGLTMTEGSVSEWLKKPGELVRKGEMLFVVSTDKADMEVESLDEGKLVQIVVEPGNVVPVGTVIAYLGGSGDAVASQPAAMPATAAGADADVLAPTHTSGKEKTEAAVKEPPAVSTAVASRAEGHPASPRARKVARELGIDISKVTPSGGSARIVEEDVRRFAGTTHPQVAKTIPSDLRRRQVIAERLTKS